MLFFSTSQFEDQGRGAGGIELRLDLMENFSLQKMEDFLRESKIEVMLTLRDRDIPLEDLLVLRPHFLDVSFGVCTKVFEKYPETKCILSYHDFEKVPDLDAIYKEMKMAAAFSYKIAAKVRNAKEAMEMLLFGKKHPDVSVIPMGEKGQFARILGPIFGNIVDYAGSVAPGQLSVEEMCQIYHYHLLNKDTLIYGLIGSPVEKSRGHIHHNALFRESGTNAVYVKIDVGDDLSGFIALAKEMGFRGLSVTMPLKEKILPFIDHIDEGARGIGAINTLRFQDGLIFGTNTDGIGALNAIEKKMRVRGKFLVVIGAGGTARAIVHEALKRGANVIVLNRSQKDDLGCPCFNLDDVPKEYDCIINTTPVSMPIDPQKIVEGKIAMDVNYAPKMSTFLQAAQDKNCTLVFGEEMYVEQARKQREFWDL